MVDFLSPLLFRLLNTAERFALSGMCLLTVSVLQVLNMGHHWEQA